MARLLCPLAVLAVACIADNVEINLSADTEAPEESNTGYTFLTLGDWGGAALGGQYNENVYAVANQMATTAASTDAKFIINTGDNFYWCGIQNASDPQIATDFELPYASDSLQITWYSILGNQ